MSTQFSVGPTRDIQAGDTPDLNDGLLSRPQAAENIARGTACYLSGGNVTIATEATSNDGRAGFVPIESVDNSGGSAGDTEMSGVVSPQRVALLVGDDTVLTTLRPGEYVKISDVAGQVTNMLTTEVAGFRFARYLGKEAALLDRDPVTPFDETLTPGVVPDQTLTVAIGATAVAWFQLVEAQGVITLP